MRDDIIVNGVTEEMVAAFLDGNATLEETQMILRELPHSDELQEIISIATGVDRDLALGFNAEEVLLKSAYAASSQRGNLCCWECEKHILNKHNIAYDEERLLQLAEENMWHCESGTPLDNVGRYLENSGMTIPLSIRKKHKISAISLLFFSVGTSSFFSKNLTKYGILLPDNNRRENAGWNRFFQKNN